LLPSAYRQVLNRRELRSAYRCEVRIAPKFVSLPMAELSDGSMLNSWCQAPATAAIKINFHGAGRQAPFVAAKCFFTAAGP
jgi:hypothetical protein